MTQYILLMKSNVDTHNELYSYSLRVTSSKVAKFEPDRQGVWVIRIVGYDKTKGGDKKWKK